MEWGPLRSYNLCQRRLYFEPGKNGWRTDVRLFSDGESCPCMFSLIDPISKRARFNA